MTSSVALLCFNVTSYYKTDFELIYVHDLIIIISIIMNIINILCNYSLFIMSFSDYFEFKERMDFDEMSHDRKND